MNEHRFDGLSNLYERYRPAYPAAFLDLLYDGPLQSGGPVADVGAGTGILTRQLLERGSTVYAVEPNPEMRRLAKQKLGGMAGFYPVDGTAEHTSLPDRCVVCVTAAQAFHWFNPEGFRQECRRILRPGGMVVLVWNSRDGESPLVQENDALNRRLCPEYRGFSGGGRGTSSEELAHFFSGGFQTHSFNHPLAFDREGFIGRNLSASYAPRTDDPGYVCYVKELERLFERYQKDGNIVMPNRTCCYLGRVS